MYTFFIFFQWAWHVWLYSVSSNILILWLYKCLLTYILSVTQCLTVYKRQSLILVHQTDICILFWLPAVYRGAANGVTTKWMSQINVWTDLEQRRCGRIRRILLVRLMHCNSFPTLLQDSEPKHAILLCISKQSCHWWVYEFSTRKVPCISHNGYLPEINVSN